MPIKVNAGMSSGYYANANADLLAAMPLDAGRVLEIGCGEGALAARYKARNPGCHYTAVEAHEPAADRARGIVDRLIAGDAEALDDAGLGGPFDLIVMGDTLEHLCEPEAYLARLHGLLAPAGALALCVPNIAHWSALREVLAGRWPVADSGLFDRTHRRFFTLDSLLAALRGAGFRPLRASPRNFAGAGSEACIAALERAVQAMGLDGQAFRQRAMALQYVIVADRADVAQAHPPLRVHQVTLAPRLLEARASLPAAALKAAPLVQFTEAQRELSIPAAPAEGGVLLLQRPRFRSRGVLVAALGRAHHQGWTVAVEFDDDPALVAQVLGDPDPAIYTDALRAADAVQTSTAALAARIAPLNPELRVFPNAVLDLGPQPPDSDSDRPGRVFYGALNRGPFAADVVAGLAPAIAAHPETEFRVAHDRAVFDALPTERKAFLGTLSYQDYLAQLDWADVALMPLEGRPEEATKSDLKWVEAAAHGAVALASPPVYADSIRHGETGLIARRPDQWPVLLARLLANPARRRRIAAAARAEIGAGRLLGHQIGDRIAWYRDLIARRHALRAAALDRMPELRTAAAASSEAGPT